MDTFTVTAYNKNTDVATITFVLVGRTGFAGGTFTGVKISGIPKDTITNVKAFLRSYADAFIAGKVSESNQQADISDEVKTLLNIATEF